MVLNLIKEIERVVADLKDNLLKMRKELDEKISKFLNSIG